MCKPRFVWRFAFPGAQSIGDVVGRKKPWTSWRFFGLKKGAKGGRHSFGGLKRYLLSVSGQRKDRPGGFGSKNH
jgi:hypothetical protein